MLCPNPECYDFQFIDDGRDFQDTAYPTCTRLLVPEATLARAVRVLAELERTGP